MPWLRSIYLGSAFAILMWMLPYAIGMLVHYFSSHRWGKAVGWLLMVLFIPSLILAFVFKLALESVLYTPNMILLSISCWVMIGQAILWRMIWFGYVRRRQTSGWRTVALPAFYASLVLAFLAFGSFVGERGTRYYEAVRAQKQIEEDREHLSAAGYEQYPGADFLFGHSLIRGSGSGCGESLSLHFRTGDSPEQVLDFYRESADRAGLRVRMGTRPGTGIPVLVVLGEDTAMEVEGWSEDTWLVTVYWDIAEDFEERMERWHELEQK